MGVVSFKFWIKLSKVLVLPDPDGPIINILNGQFLSSLLLLQILSKFNFFYVQRTQLCCILFNIFDVIIPTDPFK